MAGNYSKRKSGQTRREEGKGRERRGEERKGGGRRGEEERRDARGPPGRLRAGGERGSERKSLSQRVYIYAYIHTDLNPYLRPPH
jgi:hypothetical protein